MLRGSLLISGSKVRVLDGPPTSGTSETSGVPDSLVVPTWCHDSTVDQARHAPRLPCVHALEDTCRGRFGQRIVGRHQCIDRGGSLAIDGELRDVEARETV